MCYRPLRRIVLEVQGGTSKRVHDPSFWPAAEGAVLHSVSTGASNALEKASKIAKDMVTRYVFGETLSITVNVKKSILERDISLSKDNGRD